MLCSLVPVQCSTVLIIEFDIPFAAGKSTARS